MPPHGRLSRTCVTPHVTLHVTLTSLWRPRSPTHGPRRPHAAGHGHVLGRDTDIMQTCHVTGTGRGGPITLDVVRADGEWEAIASAPAPACTRSRWSIRRRFDISPVLAPVRSGTTSCPPNVHPSTSLRSDPRSNMATSAFDASPRPDYTYDQPAAGVTSLYEGIRRLHDDTGELLMQLRRRRRPIRPLRRCGRHVYDPRSTRHRIAASFPAPEPPTSFTHPCSCEPTNSQVLPIGPAVLMAGDRYTYAGNDPVNGSDPSGLYTIGICASGSAALGIGWYHWGTPTGSLCLVRTRFTPRGNDDIGFTDTGGWTVGSVGASAGASLTIQVSDANRLAELGQRFTQDSVSPYGFGWGAAADYFWGTAQDGRQIHGVNIGVDFGAGASIAKFSTWTDVKQVNNTILANLLRGVWDGLLPPGVRELRTIQNWIAAAAEDESTSGAMNSSAPSDCVGRNP